MPLSKRKVTSADELSSADEAASRSGAPTKKAKTLKSTRGTAGDTAATVEFDDEGNAFWELSGRRRITISEFKGKRMISVREYYEKDGKELPGKKGISLPLDQFSTLISLLPQIEEQLSSKGDKVSRPAYGTGQSKVDTDASMETAQEGKENYEETSEED